MDNILEIGRAYIAAKAEEDAAKARKDELKKQLEKIFAQGKKEIEVDGSVISLQKKEAISFDPAILPYLKQNGLESYVREAIDESGLKKAIKNSEIMKASLAKYIKTKHSTAVIVEKSDSEKEAM